MAARKRLKCPICGRPAVARYRPFCSKRCADVDLGRWLEGRYRLPAVTPPEEADGDDWQAEEPTNGGADEDGGR